jgi:hypothetical protein
MWPDFKNSLAPEEKHPDTHATNVSRESILDDEVNEVRSGKQYLEYCRLDNRPAPAIDR